MFLRKTSPTLTSHNELFDSLCFNPYSLQKRTRVILDVGNVIKETNQALCFPHRASEERQSYPKLIGKPRQVLAWLSTKAGI
jgi:hypothetical protein